MGARIGNLRAQQLGLITALVLLPGVVALLALGGEPWRMLDRPMYAGQLTASASSLDGGFELSLGRGSVAALVWAVAAAGLVFVAAARQRESLDSILVSAGLMGVSTVVLASLTHAFWLAEAVDTSRLHSPTARRGVSIDLFMMTGSQWSQALPCVLLSLYAIAALVTILGLLAVHAKERRQARQRAHYVPAQGWSTP